MSNTDKRASMLRDRLLIDQIALSESERKQKQGELLARVYTLILSPEWQEDTPPPPPLERDTLKATEDTHE